MDKKQHFSFMAQKNSKQTARRETITVIVALVVFFLIVAISAHGGNAGLTHI